MAFRPTDEETIKSETLDTDDNKNNNEEVNLANKLSSPTTFPTLFIVLSFVNSLTVNFATTSIP
jgi:hypothetical protein